MLKHKLPRSGNKQLIPNQSKLFHEKSQSKLKSEKKCNELLPIHLWKESRLYHRQCWNPIPCDPSTESHRPSLDAVPVRSTADSLPPPQGLRADSYRTGTNTTSDRRHPKPHNLRRCWMEFVEWQSVFQSHIPLDWPPDAMMRVNLWILFIFVNHFHHLSWLKLQINCNWLLLLRGQLFVKMC